MIKSPIFQLKIKLLLTEEREREVSTTTSSSCLGRDRRGPHPIAASIDWCFCHRRFENSAAFIDPSWDGQSLLNRHGVFQDRRHIEGNDPVAESFVLWKKKIDSMQKTANKFGQESSKYSAYIQERLRSTASAEPRVSR